MQNLILLILLIGVGIGLKRFGVLKEDAHIGLNRILLYVCLPAVTLLSVSEMQFEAQYLLPIFMPWLVFGGSVCFFHFLDKFLDFKSDTKAVLILTAGIPSVSFVGFPIFELLYGQQGLEIGILMSQMGSFLVCSTMGVILASYYSSSQAKVITNPKEILLNVLKFPTFIAFILAVLLNLTNLQLNPIFISILTKMAAPFSFLALIAIGLQVPMQKADWQIGYIKWGLSYKLIIAPILIFIIYYLIIQKKNLILESSVIGASLGPMNTVAIIASNYGLSPKLASQMVGIGIPISLITLYVFYLLLQLF